MYKGTKNVLGKKERGKRAGQVSIEFMIFIGMAIMILAVFTIMVVMYIDSIYLEREKLISERFVDTIKYEIDVASRMGDGYVRIIKLPSSVGGWSYDLFFDRRYVFMRVESESEQGDIISGLSADIENFKAHRCPVFHIEYNDEGGREIVVEKNDDEIYVCGLDWYDEKGSCVEYEVDKNNC
ncbi:MAG: hypothetical protein KKG60_00475 [Nanoarchaeota archaeon]|nr:hypothetical protein [Nanoarchaeota archaeon]